MERGRLARKKDHEAGGTPALPGGLRVRITSRFTERKRPKTLGGGHGPSSANSLWKRRVTASRTANT
jgi:hypothetical protein